jgi:autotransporter-like protein
VSANGEKAVLKKIIGRMLGCALLLSYGGAASAFTLITFPPASQEQASPSNTVTDSATLQTQVQPVATTIRSQVFGHLRPRSGGQRAQVGGLMLAANAQGGTTSDIYPLAAVTGDSSGGGSGAGGGNSESAWISAATNSQENTFSRTAFYGATHNLLAGFDVTRSEKYVLGVSVGNEASNYTTRFNTGDQRVRGYSVNPYFAYLLSSTWSWDLILGYGQFDTRQSRTLATLVGPVAVDSDFSSKRSFAATNLANVSTWGDLKITGSLGYLGSRRQSDAYTESNGSAVDSAKQTSKQWNLLGEAAYGRGNSEGFFGATYEHNRNADKIVFSSGEQPANDPSSVVLTAGLRYFGRGMSANFVFNRRVGQEQFNEYGFAMLLRFDL